VWSLLALSGAVAAAVLGLVDLEAISDVEELVSL